MKGRISYFVGFSLVLAISACASPAESPFSDDQLEFALTEESAARTAEADQDNQTVVPALASDTPTVTAEADVQIDPQSPHDDGVYIVGAEIAEGVWRSTSESQRFCYWARRKYDGIVLGSYYGLPGIEMRVFPTDYEVELDGCGTWIFMGSN